MTTREFQPDDIISIPRLNVAGAHALVTEVITAARAHQPLPANISRALTKLELEFSHFTKAASDQHGIPSEDTKEARVADVWEDGAFRAINNWLSGWMELPKKFPQVALSTELFTLIFAEGMGFTQIAFKLEWAEAQSRIDAIRAKKLEGTFAQLGGEPLWKNLLAAHKHYGSALGITVGKEPKEPSVNLRTALDAIGTALRTYIVKVTAHVDEEDAHSKTVAEALLRPVAEWHSNERTLTAVAPSPGPDAPETGATPAAPASNTK